MKLSKITGAIKRRSIWVMLYAVYLALILITVHALMAEDSISDIRKDMDVNYTYNLIFTKNGKTTHYDVTRYDTGEPGKISLTYWTQDNKLDVTNVQNIKTLKIDVQSMFEDESMKVFKKDPSASANLHMDYWLEAGDGVFTVEFNIAKSEPIENLTFTKFPTPKSVTVNNNEWWKTNTNYVKSGNEITISEIPTGKTTVVLYFKLTNQLPTAEFTMNPATFAGVNENISFNAAQSSDPDGELISWVWDFGDQTSDSGKTVTHKYSKPGTYTIKLTVRDDAEPFGEGSKQKNIIVKYGAEDDFDGDGLRDAWEMQFFNTTSYSGTDDFDNDGVTNKVEQDSGTDPTDKESKPADKVDKGDKPTSDSGLLMILAVVIIVVILLVVVMFVLKSKKSKTKEEEEHDEEAITELEEKIQRAKSLGLPTRELERLLREAKEGKPLEVKPMSDKHGTSKGKGRGKDLGRGKRRA